MGSWLNIWIWWRLGISFQVFTWDFRRRINIFKAHVLWTANEVLRRYRGGDRRIVLVLGQVSGCRDRFVTVEYKHDQGGIVEYYVGGELN